MTTRIESRIADLASNAREVAKMCETELGGRVIYLTRAGVMIKVIRSTLEAMSTLESEGAAGDFNAVWRSLRLRLAGSQMQFQRIIAGADASLQPCRTQYL